MNILLVPAYVFRFFILLLFCVFRAALAGNEFATAIDVEHQHTVVHLLYVIFNSETNTASITYDAKQQI